MHFFFSDDVSMVTVLCPILWLRAQQHHRRFHLLIWQQSPVEKQTEGFFSLGTGTLPISPYECPVHFTELMKSCTDGIHLNKGCYSQGRFLCGVSWAVSQLA